VFFLLCFVLADFFLSIWCAPQDWFITLLWVWIYMVLLVPWVSRGGFSHEWDIPSGRLRVRPWKSSIFSGNTHLPTPDPWQGLCENLLEARCPKKKTKCNKHLQYVHNKSQVPVLLRENDDKPIAPMSNTCSWRISQYNPNICLYVYMVYIYIISLYYMYIFKEYIICLIYMWIYIYIYIYNRYIYIYFVVYIIYICLCITWICTKHSHNHTSTFPRGAKSSPTGALASAPGDGHVEHGAGHHHGRLRRGRVQN